MNAFARSLISMVVILMATASINAADTVKSAIPTTQQPLEMKRTAPAINAPKPKGLASPNTASASGVYKINPATLNMLKYRKATSPADSLAAQSGEKAFKHFQAVYVQFYRAVGAAEKKIDNDCLVRGYSFNDKKLAGCQANETGQTCDIKLVKYCAAMELNTVRGLYPGLIKEFQSMISIIQYNFDTAKNIPDYMKPYF